MIESNEDLTRHLRHEREIYARTLEMYRIGEMRVVANAVDITTYQMTNLQGIINNIDQMLERMDKDVL